MIEEIDKLKDIINNTCNIFTENKTNMDNFCKSYGVLCASEKYDNLIFEFKTYLDSSYKLINSATKQFVLKDRQKSLKYLEEYAVNEAVILITLLTCESILSSGRYHIYRAILNPQGMTFAFIHQLLLKEAEDKNYLNLEQVTQIKNSIRDGIQSVG